MCSPFKSIASGGGRYLTSRVGVCGTDLKEYEDGGGLRDFRDVGVPLRWYSLIRRADTSEPSELSLASLRSMRRGKVRFCTVDDVGRGIMESEDVGGCEPDDELSRRLETRRNNPEKVETIDALEWTEDGRVACKEEEGICKSGGPATSARTKHVEHMKDNELW